jgi:hypothetical protein
VPYAVGQTKNRHCMSQRDQPGHIMKGEGREGKQNYIYKYEGY